MPFQFKLAKRLALAHVSILLLLAACAGEDPAGLTIASFEGLAVSPGTLTLSRQQSVQFSAHGAGSRDSASIPVTWIASGGEITPTGKYTARDAGTYAVTAIDRSGHEARASVTVVEDGVPGFPPPEPPRAAASECVAPRAEWIWCDDFERDRLASYFEYNNAEGNFVRAPAAGLQGSSGMRAHWNAGAIGAGWLHLAIGKTPSANFRPVDAGTTKYREIYWRLYVKQQASWVGGGPVKLSRAFVFTSANYTQAAIAHVWNGTTSPDNEYLIVDPASGTDGAGNVITTGYNDFSHLRWLGSARGSLPMFAAGHHGQWYCVEAHMRLNSPGASDGVLEVAVNGMPQGHRSGLNYVGSYAEYGINAVYVENYWNAGSAASQDRYIDNFVVSTAPIGC